MNRFTEKIVHWSVRLAFWHKTAEATPRHPEYRDSETIKNIESDPSAAIDVPALEAGLFSRLKQLLLRWRNTRQEELPDPALAVTKERRAAVEQPDASATADEVPALKLPFTVRLKNKFRRQPKPEQTGEDAGKLKPAEDKHKEATPSGDADSSGNEEAMDVSRKRQVLALLSNKWVWISSAGVMLMAIIAVMLVMLLQSAKEKEQLEVDLLATQKKLGQTAITKRAAGTQGSSRSASGSSMETAGSSVDPNLDINAEDCLVTSTESVAQNLKNCIESFNRSVSN